MRIDWRIGDSDGDLLWNGGLSLPLPPFYLEWSGSAYRGPLNRKYLGRKQRPHLLRDRARAGCLLPERVIAGADTPNARAALGG